MITESLADHEIAHEGLHRLEIVRTMHQRKARMAELSDAVIMLPGGFGTYEEFMETVTWVHLGIHDKPCGVLNVDGFFDLLLRFMAAGRRRWASYAPHLVDGLGRLRRSRRAPRRTGAGRGLRWHLAPVHRLARGPSILHWCST